jgi:hypothetical protein
MTQNIRLHGDATSLHSVLPTMPYASQDWYCFRSPETICEYLAKLTPRDFWTGQGRSDIPEGTRLAREGWGEGAVRVARLRDRINASAPVERRLRKFNVAGGLVDVPRYLSGDPRCMRDLDSIKSRRRPVITLVNNIAGLCNVPDQAFANKAAVVASVVDAIEGAGYSCEVIGVAPSKGCEDSNWLCAMAFLVKEAGYALDVGKLAFGLGHTIMWRGLGFAVYSVKGNEKLGYGHGRTVDNFGELPANTFLLPSLNEHYRKFSSEDQAATVGLAFVLETLREQDCPAFPREEVAA